MKVIKYKKEYKGKKYNIYVEKQKELKGKQEIDLLTMRGKLK